MASSNSSGTRDWQAVGRPLAGVAICLLLLAGGAWGLWSYLLPPDGGGPVASHDLADARRAAASAVPTIRASAGRDAPGSPADARRAAAVKIPLIEAVAGPDARKAAAAQLTGGIADLRVVGEPPLEVRRQQEERANAAGPRVETGFECASKFDVRHVSPTHFAMTMVPPRGDERMPGIKDWFLFRVAGAKGCTVRFDIMKEFSPDNWHPLNPVFAYAADPADAGLYPAPLSPPGDAVATVAAYNGVRHPVGGSGRWEWVEQTWQADETTFSFVQTFAEDQALVALRFPRPPSYNERFFAALAGNPYAKVIEIGRSGEGRPLLMAQVGQSDLTTKPCVLIYGGEHADEQDSMWVAQGALERVLGDGPESKRLRDRLTFFVIPSVDPDGTAAGVHSRITSSYMTPGETVETAAFSNWFQSWVNAGNRLDVVLNFHNIQAQGPHASLFEAEVLGDRGRIGRAMSSVVGSVLGRAGFTSNTRAHARGWSPARLGGWLSRRYGPVTFLYEIDCQSPDGHLDVNGMRRLGAAFDDAQLAFFGSSDPAVSLLSSNVDARRAEGRARWAGHEPLPSGLNAIQAEAIVSKGVGLRAKPGDELLIEDWVP